MRERELRLPRTTRRHGEDDAADADPHQRADLQQPASRLLKMVAVWLVS
jgi:hypothetical protein